MRILEKAMATRFCQLAQRVLRIAWSIRSGTCISTSTWARQLPVRHTTMDSVGTSLGKSSQERKLAQ